MIIQSTRVWVSGQFMEAQVEMVDGKIAHIYPYAPCVCTSINPGNTLSLP